MADSISSLISITLDGERALLSGSSLGSGSSCAKIIEGFDCFLFDLLLSREDIEALELFLLALPTAFAFFFGLKLLFCLGYLVPDLSDELEPLPSALLF